MVTPSANPFLFFVLWLLFHAAIARALLPAYSGSRQQTAWPVSGRKRQAVVVGQHPGRLLAAVEVVEAPRLCT